jgi:membrane protein implicated in regulation of membrane protease activity
MSEWWSGLNFSLQVFYGIGILATVILVIQLIMTLLGADGDGMADDGAFDAAGADADVLAGHDTGLQILSVRTVVAFLAGFGWTGVIVLQAGRSMTSAVLIALGVGILLMLAVFSLMRGLYSLRQSGSVDYRNAIGAVGTVYVRIPPAGEGTGQIQVVVQGRLATVAAANRGDKPLAGGTKVKVVGLSGANLLEVEGV